MDENLVELENELKRLSPRRPSRPMLAAIERDLARRHASGSPGVAVGYSTATTLRGWKWTTWALVGAAAVLALAFTLPAVFEDPKAPGDTPVIARQAEASAAATDIATIAPTTLDRYEPVQASTVLYAMHESSPRTLPDRTEGREVRYRFVDTYTWKNPARNASVRWSVPRDEVRLVRANLD
jgi:hypothetical protein